jgi:hypothetical protein
VRFCLLTLFFLTTFLAHGSTNSHQGKVFLKAELNRDLSEGDIVEATLELWPVEKIDEVDLQGLVNKVFLKNYYIVDAGYARSSIHNADVAEVDMLLAIGSGAKSGDQIEQEIGKKTYLVKIDFPEIKKMNEEIQGIVFWDVLRKGNFRTELTLSIAFIVCILGGLFMIWSKKKRGQPAEKGLRKDELENILAKGKSRRDFEKIYELRNQIKEKCHFDDKALHKFLRRIEEIQYKRSWTEDELSSLSSMKETIGRGEHGI